MVNHVWLVKSQQQQQQFTNYKDRGFALAVKKVVRFWFQTEKIRQTLFTKRTKNLNASVSRIFYVLFLYLSICTYRTIIRLFWHDFTPKLPRFFAPKNCHLLLLHRLSKRRSVVTQFFWAPVKRWLRGDFLSFGIPFCKRGCCSVLSCCWVLAHYGDP